MMVPPSFDVQGGFPGEGNIAADPNFLTPGYWSNPADPAATWIGGDYHLRKGSPCIDAGDPGFVLKQSPVDMDGQPRIIGLRPDIGCDEAAPKEPDTAAGL